MTLLVYVVFSLSFLFVYLMFFSFLFSFFHFLHLHGDLVSHFSICIYHWRPWKGTRVTEPDGSGKAGRVHKTVYSSSSLLFFLFYRKEYMLGVLRFAFLRFCLTMASGLLLLLFVSVLQLYSSIGGDLTVCFKGLLSSGLVVFPGVFFLFSLLYFTLFFFFFSLFLLSLLSLK